MNEATTNALQFIVPLLAGLAGIAGAWLTAKIQHRGRPENALIDQLQQEIGTLRREFRRLEARDRIYLPHILRLNRMVEKLGGTPPKLPNVLEDYLNGDGEEDPEDAPPS